MRRVGILASVVMLVLTVSPTAVSASSPDRFAAPIEGDGITGRVVVKIAASGESGILKWSLEGLKPSRQLVIDVKRGTCTNRGALVVRHTRYPGSKSEANVALPSGSASDFMKAWNHQGVVAIVKSGNRSDCTAFSEME
jgi:hypothetical protein